MKKMLPTIVVSALLSALLTYSIVKPPTKRQAVQKSSERCLLPGISYKYNVQRHQDPEHRTPENVREIRAYSAPIKATPGEEWVDGHLYTGSWNTLEAGDIVFKFQDPDDLKTFNRKVRHPGQSGFLQLFSSSKDPQERTRQKLDTIFEKVKKLTDLEYEVRDKVKVLLFKNTNQLHAEFHKIYGHRHPKIRAWYIFEYNTIYASIDDLHEGILSHEMAHAVVDNYLKARLPREISEIIARYVDSNLMA